ncbi:MAG TPA: nucleotide exchange factor GrpE [Gammaproteobacteria bacterium]|nr:nucleotide exchange factor GrpE [Gammaproteobacteria bacterium]
MADNRDDDQDIVETKNIDTEKVDYDLTEEADNTEVTEGSAKEPGKDEETDNLLNQLEASQKKAEEHWDQLVRLQAEMENLRKRNSKEVENARKFGLEKMAKELLSVRDSLEMGLNAAKAENVELEQIREGMDLTLKNLIQVMEKFDIVAVDPMGEKFNPELHQAMNTQETEGVEPNTVVMVMQKGYTLNDRLIRPALVGVSK